MVEPEDSPKWPSWLIDMVAVPPVVQSCVAFGEEVWRERLDPSIFDAEELAAIMHRSPRENGGEG